MAFPHIARFFRIFDLFAFPRPLQGPFFFFCRNTNFVIWMRVQSLNCTRVFPFLSNRIHIWSSALTHNLHNLQCKLIKNVRELATTILWLQWYSHSFTSIKCNLSVTMRIAFSYSVLSHFPRLSKHSNVNLCGWVIWPIYVSLMTKMKSIAFKPTSVKLGVKFFFLVFSQQMFRFFF